jgi:hypothetical protein
MISCDPKSLSQSAAGFKRIPRQMLGAVKTFLLCQFANAGGTPPAPADPFNPDISDNSLPGSEIVTWSQASAPTSNEVWRSVNGGAFALRGTVAGALTTFTDVGVMPANDIWTYKIRAVTGGVPSAFTTTVSIGFDLDFNAGAQLTLSFPDLIVVLSDFQAMNMPNVVSISAPKLRTVTGANGVLWQFNPLMTSVDISSLKNVTNGFLSVQSCTSLTTLSAPKLVQLSQLFINDSTVSVLSVPLLTTVFGEIVFLNTPLIVASFPSLTSVGNGVGLGIRGQNCPALTSVSLPVCGICGGPIDLSQDGALATFSAPSFIFTDGNIFDWTNDALTAASEENILSRGVASGLVGSDFELSGGTNAGLASLSVQGQADFATLTGAGNTVNINP